MKRTMIVTTVVAAVLSCGLMVYGVNNSAAEGESGGDLVATNTELANEGLSKVITKDETVYIITDAEGVMEKSFVEGTLNTSSEAMPVEMKVKYTLDGSDISADELAGKSGHVKMTYEFASTKSHQGKLVPFLTVTGINLDGAKFNNVKIDNGKIISDGDGYTLAGYTFAGLGEDLGVDVFQSEFTVEAEVKDFALENTYTLATNEIFAEVDTSKLYTLDSVTEAIDELAAGFEKIVNGSASLNEGLDTALAGARELSSGAGKVSAGAESLNAGAAKVAGGANELAAGVTTINNGANEISDNVAGLNDGLSELSGNSAAVQQGATEVFNSLIGQTNAKISGNAALAGIIAGYNIPFPLTITNYGTSLSTLIDYVAAESEDTTDLVVAKASLDSYKDFYAGVMQYTGTVDYIAGLTPDLAAGAQQLAAGTGKLNTTGASKLAAGADEVSAGAGQLATGAGELKAGMDKMTAGMEQLATGGKTLYNGLNTFKTEGIDRLVDFANNDLDGFLNKLRGTVAAAKNYHHYSSNSAKSVKFVFKTGAVK